MSRQIIKDDLRFLLFSEIYSRFDEPKTKRKAFALLEAAIQCFDRKGFEGTTLNMIAREAGISRPLLNHYFKGMQEIRETSIKYIRVLFQKIAVDAMSKSERPDEMLKQYIEACFFWAENFKTHRHVWLRFLSSCGKSKSDRLLNTRSVNAGSERLAQLLSKGQSTGVFTCSDHWQAARLIQLTVLGALTAYATENSSSNVDLSSSVIRQCMIIAGADLKFSQSTPR